MYIVLKHKQKGLAVRWGRSHKAKQDGGPQILLLIDGRIVMAPTHSYLLFSMWPWYVAKREWSVWPSALSCKWYCTAFINDSSWAPEWSHGSGLKCTSGTLHQTCSSRASISAHCCTLSFQLSCRLNTDSSYSNIQENWIVM